MVTSFDYPHPLNQLSAILPYFVWPLDLWLGLEDLHPLGYVLCVGKGSRQRLSWLVFLLIQHKLLGKRKFS